MRDPVREVASWAETDNQTNATATATRSAPDGGLKHFITSISGSFGGNVTAKTLILKYGSTEVARWYVNISFGMCFSSPIELPAGTAANLELEASGAAMTDGAVNMTGYTL